MITVAVLVVAAAGPVGAVEEEAVPEEVTDAGAEPVGPLPIPATAECVGYTPLAGSAGQWEIAELCSDFPGGTQVPAEWAATGCMRGQPDGSVLFGECADPLTDDEVLAAAQASGLAVECSCGDGGIVGEATFTVTGVPALDVVGRNAQLVLRLTDGAGGVIDSVTGSLLAPPTVVLSADIDVSSVTATLLVSGADGSELEFGSRSHSVLRISPTAQASDATPVDANTSGFVPLNVAPAPDSFALPAVGNVVTPVVNALVCVELNCGVGESTGVPASEWCVLPNGDYYGPPDNWVGPLLPCPAGFVVPGTTQPGTNGLPPFTLPGVTVIPRPRDEDDLDYDPDLPPLTGDDELPNSDTATIDGGRVFEILIATDYGFRDGDWSGHNRFENYLPELFPNDTIVIIFGDTLHPTRDGWFPGRLTEAEIDFLGSLDNDVIFRVIDDPKADHTHTLTIDGVVTIEDGVNNINVDTDDGFVLYAPNDENLNIDGRDSEHAAGGQLGGGDDDVEFDDVREVVFDGGAGEDDLDVAGDGSVALYGNDGDDRLRGSGEDVFLDGGAGDDRSTLGSDGIVEIGDGHDTAGFADGYDEQILRIDVPDGIGPIDPSGPRLRPDGDYDVEVVLGADGDADRSIARNGDGTIFDTDDYGSDNPDIWETGDGRDMVVYEVRHDLDEDDIIVRTGDGGDYFEVQSADGREAQDNDITVTPRILNPRFGDERSITVELGDGDDIASVDVTYVIDVERFTDDYVDEMGALSWGNATNLDPERFNYLVNEADLDPLDYMIFVAPDGTLIDGGEGSDRVILNVLTPMPHKAQGRLGEAHIPAGLDGFEFGEFVGEYLPDTDSDDDLPPGDRGSIPSILSAGAQGLRYEYEITLQVDPGSSERVGDLIEYGEFNEDGEFIPRGEIRLNANGSPYNHVKIWLSSDKLGFRDPNPELNEGNPALSFQVYSSNIEDMLYNHEQGDPEWPRDADGPADTLIPHVVLDEDNNYVLDATRPTDSRPGVWWDPLDLLRPDPDSIGSGGSGNPGDDDDDNDPPPPPPSTPAELAADLGRQPSATELFDFYARTTTISADGFQGMLTSFDVPGQTTLVGVSDLETPLTALTGQGLEGAILRNLGPDTMEFTAEYWNGETEDISLESGEAWEFGTEAQFHPVGLGTFMLDGQEVLTATTISDGGPLGLFTLDTLKQPDGSDYVSIGLPPPGQLMFSPGGSFGMASPLVVETVVELQSGDLLGNTAADHHLYGFPATYHAEGIVMPIDIASRNALIESGNGIGGWVDPNVYGNQIVGHTDFELQNEITKVAVIPHEVDGEWNYYLHFTRYEKLADGAASGTLNDIKNANGGTLYQYTSTVYSLNQLDIDTRLPGPVGSNNTRRDTLSPSDTDYDLDALEAELEQLIDSRPNFVIPSLNLGVDHAFTASGLSALDKRIIELENEIQKAKATTFDAVIENALSHVYGTFGDRTKIKEIDQHQLDEVLRETAGVFLDQFDVGALPNGTNGHDNVSVLPFGLNHDVAGLNTMVDLRTSEGELQRPAFGSDIDGILDFELAEINQLQSRPATKPIGDMLQAVRTFSDDSASPNEIEQATSLFYTAIAQAGAVIEGGGSAIASADKSGAAAIIGGLGGTIRQLGQTGVTQQWLTMSTIANNLAMSSLQLNARSAEGTAGFQGALIEANLNPEAKQNQVSQLELEAANYAASLFRQYHENQWNETWNQAVVEHQPVLQNNLDQKNALENYNVQLSQATAQHEQAVRIFNYQQSQDRANFDATVAGSRQRLTSAVDQQSVGNLAEINTLIADGDLIAQTLVDMGQQDKLKDLTYLRPVSYNGGVKYVPSIDAGAQAVVVDGRVIFADPALQPQPPTFTPPTAPVLTGEVADIPDLKYTAPLIDAALGSVTGQAFSPDIDAAVQNSVDQLYTLGQQGDFYQALNMATTIDGDQLGTVYVDALRTELLNQWEAEGFGGYSSIDDVPRDSSLGQIFGSLDRYEAQLNTSYRDYVQVSQMSDLLGGLTDYVIDASTQLSEVGWETLGSDSQLTYSIVNTLPK